MRSTPTRRQTKPSEEGYILVAVIFMLAILLISLSVAAPKIAREIQRDRELETMQRGKQYIRAIRMYYKKNNAYPPNIDALIKPSNAVNIRYLRKRYVDPTTGKEEWKAIHFGQNKAPTAMGFFGQPLMGSTLAGVGAGGAGNIPGASAAGSSFMGTSTNSGASSGTDTSGTAGNAATTTPSGTGSTLTGSGTDSSGTSGSSSTFGTGGQTFGGLGIIGFSPNSPKASILTYKTKNHYNEWEFVYDPIIERMTVGGVSGAGSGAVPASGIGNSAGGISGGGLGGISGGGGFGTTPTPTPTPAQPTSPTQ